MTHDNEERRPAGNGTALKDRLTTHPDSTPSTPVDESSRCLACHRPLTAAKSIAHEAGPVCWARAVTAQAEAVRADAVADLEAVAGIVRAAPVPVLVAVRAALADLAEALGELDALDAAGVTR